MSSSSVWVQLYYKGKDEPKGRPTSVKKPKDVEESEWNVDALAAVVLPKLDPIELAEVFVYCTPLKPHHLSPRTRQFILTLATMFQPVLPPRIL